MVVVVAEGVMVVVQVVVAGRGNICGRVEGIFVESLAGLRFTVIRTAQYPPDVGPLSGRRPTFRVRCDIRLMPVASCRNCSKSEGSCLPCRQNSSHGQKTYQILQAIPAPRWLCGSFEGRQIARLQPRCFGRSSSGRYFLWFQKDDQRPPNHGLPWSL